jgi:hypothetical protein
MANAAIQRLSSEPATINGVVQAFIALLLSFGVGLTTDQVGAILAFTSIVGALLTRIFVTPTSKTATTTGDSNATD